MTEPTEVPTLMELTFYQYMLWFECVPHISCVENFVPNVTVLRSGTLGGEWVMRTVPS